MSKVSPKKRGINKDFGGIRQDPYQIQINITNEEREHYNKLASILSCLYLTHPDGTIGPLLPDKHLKTLAKTALSFMNSVITTKIFMNSGIAANLQDKEALNEFVAFRVKYMNFPVDKQIEDLKRVGVVKSSSN